MPLMPNIIYIENVFPISQPYTLYVRSDVHVSCIQHCIGAGSSFTIHNNNYGVNVMPKWADAHKHQCLHFHRTQNENAEMDLAFHFVVFSPYTKTSTSIFICIVSSIPSYIANETKWNLIPHTGKNKWKLNTEHTHTHPQSHNLNGSFFFYIGVVVVGVVMFGKKAVCYFCIH